VAACEQKYHHHEKDREKTVAWSSTDHLFPKKLRDEDGLSWEEIATSFPGRSANACMKKYLPNKKGIAPLSQKTDRRSDSNRRSRSSPSDRDNDEGNSSNNEDENEEVAAASEPSPTTIHHDDVVLPPVISSSSSVARTYYPPPPLPRNQRRKFSSSCTRRDEKLINKFCCGICCKLIFRAQVMRPCGCHVFCEECVPPIDARTSACSTCSTPFEQALPCRTGNNIAEQMVRAKFVKSDVAAEWKSRGVEYARERQERP
jgi:hypothetical protein